MKFRMAASLLGVFVAAALFSASALGQSMTTLKMGQTTAGIAESRVELYRIGGVAGTELTLTLTGAGSSGVILYTPEGEEMLAAQGKDAVRLTAILPLDDVFLVSVIRDQRTPYSLKVDGLEPDGHFADFAWGVGYANKNPNGVTRTQCWIDPGRKIRFTRSNGEVYFGTIGRGGKTYYDENRDGQSSKWEVVRTVEGDKVVTVRTDAGGGSRTTRRPIVERGKPNAGFVGYLCV